MTRKIRFVTAPLVLLLCALSFSRPSRAAEAAADYAATPATAGDMKSQLQTYFFDAARSGNLPITSSRLRVPT